MKLGNPRMGLKEQNGTACPGEQKNKKNNEILDSQVLKHQTRQGSVSSHGYHGCRLRTTSPSKTAANRHFVVLPGSAMRILTQSLSTPPSHSNLSTLYTQTFPPSTTLPRGCLACLFTAPAVSSYDPRVCRRNRHGTGTAETLGKDVIVDHLPLYHNIKTKARP
eukprot:scaffold39781_cov45-Cyclotella_meneghiniana.AAC.1